MVIPEMPMQFISLDIAHMPVDSGCYKYFCLWRYIFEIHTSDTVKATAIIDALLKYWIYIHGTPYFLLSDQGSNVDGAVMQEICNHFGIEKRRSSAYHSQGNAFAERNICSVIRDMLRQCCYMETLLKRNGDQDYPIIFS